MNIRNIVSDGSDEFHFSIAGFQVAGNTIEWDEFLLYCPLGNLVDEKNGKKYVTVPAYTITLTQDLNRDKAFHIYATDSGVYAEETFLDTVAVLEPLINENGAVLINGVIPAGNADICIDVMDVPYEQ